MQKAEFWIDRLQLLPHPEGGYYRETYRSSGSYAFNNTIPFNGSRSYATAIYYLLKGGDISLVEAIGIAGGFTNFAARNSVKIIRSQNGQETVIRVKVDAITEAGTQLREVILQPHDIVIVPQSFF